MTQREFDDGDEDDVPEWADHVMATVANEVKRRRKEIGWSAQQLSDRCKDIGHPIPRNVIANMESGRRTNLPLVDVIVLAEALWTSPICLIYPVGYVPEVQRLPLQERIPPWEALLWFSAHDDAGLDDHEMLHQQRQHISALSRAESAMASEGYARHTVETEKDPVRRTEAQRAHAVFAERVSQARESLREARSYISGHGGLLPYLPPELADIDPPDTDDEDDI
ncbi:helix-turn-helix domain-containing protein [Streptomyces sp. NPDC090046]|uniref:helix-turn-helix domain-containing protein n=1 Tax=unclassified Streptomyces TaxID=2593676 RepID=UPI00382F6DB1